MTITQHLKTGASAVIASILLVALMLAPVSAQANKDDVATRKEQVKQKVEEQKTKGKKDVADKRSEARELATQEKRQAACERKQAKLANTMDSIGDKVGRFSLVIDKKYEQVQDFYNSGKLGVANYEEMAETVDNAKNASQLEIEALSELNTELDCEDPDVSATIAAYRSGVNDVKQSLREYRKALVELISSMRASIAAEKQDSSSTDDSKDDDEEQANDDDTSSNETDSNQSDDADSNIEGGGSNE